jgi:nitrate/TMAO reductase-like tetraheme cytochrome c subunit
MRRVAIATAAALLGAAGGAAGWAVSDRLEQDNDFCNACHLDAETPLHREVRREFDARPTASLAAAHGAALVEGRADSAFRCIDCHGGTGALGKLRVKVLAGKDAFWYVAGRFEEPEGMRWPLWDEDCRQCHAEFAGQSWQGWGAEPFHARPVHNTALGVDCVECHAAHGAGGNPDGYFLHAAHVRAQCARCHEDFAEEGT